MEWTNSSTPFSYPSFVAWRIKPKGVRKGRAAEDIRGLNPTTQPDIYPLSLRCSIHRTTDWLNDRLRSAVQELSYLLERIKKEPLSSEPHVIIIKNIHLNQALNYTKEYYLEEHSV